MVFSSFSIMYNKSSEITKQRVADLNGGYVPCEQVYHGYLPGAKSANGQNRGYVPDRNNANGQGK